MKSRKKDDYVGLFDHGSVVLQVQHRYSNGCFWFKQEITVLLRAN